MAERWNPWRTLRAHGRAIDLVWADLECGGLLRPAGKRWQIVLDRNLTRTERTCVLAHELIHYERRDLLGGRATRFQIALEERMVRRLTAERLVPPDQLENWVRQRTTVEPVTAATVAAEFDVTPAVARLACHIFEAAA